MASPYDEMLDGAGAPRLHCRNYWSWLEDQPAELLAQKRNEADALFHRVGITFAVYGENAGTVKEGIGLIALLREQLGDVS